MKIVDLKEFTGGWIIGTFEPSLLHTDQFEVGVKFHESGSYWAPHVHRIITEYNILIAGSLQIGNVTLVAGTCFVIKPNEVSNPVFLEDCTVVVVKVPSNSTDKYIVD